MKLFIGSLFSLLFISLDAGAHARLDDMDQDGRGELKPRTIQNNQLKGFPCAGQVKSETAPVSLVADSTVEIAWRETINHPGYYRIMFSADGDQTWTQLGPDIIDDQDQTDDLPHLFSASVRLPDFTCENCTIQLIQVMTEGGNETFYYNCADVNLIGSQNENPFPRSDSCDPSVE